MVAIIPLTEDVGAQDVSSRLAQSIDATLEDDPVTGLRRLRFVGLYPSRACSSAA